MSNDKEEALMAVTRAVDTALKEIYGENQQFVMVTFGDNNHKTDVQIMSDAEPVKIMEVIESLIPVIKESITQIEKNEANLSGARH